MQLTKLKVGPAKHTKGGVLVVSHYPADGSIVLIIESDDGSRERQAVATICLAEFGVQKPQPGTVWLKSWSENEYIPEALAAAGHVILTGRVVKLPPHDAEAIEARANGPLLDAILQYIQERGL